jgi:hypothetical protein
MDNWFKQEAGQHFQKYIETWLGVYLSELTENYIDAKGNDTSATIRGRIFQLREFLKLPEELKSYEKMKIELSNLETEGYTKETDPSNMRAVGTGAENKTN